MNRNAKIVCSVLAVAGLSSLWLTRPTSKEPKSGSETKEPQSSPAALAEVDALAQAVLRSQEDKSPLEDHLTRDQYASLNEKLKKIDPAYLEEQILAADRTLAQYHELRKKVVKSDDEKREYASLLSDVRKLGGFVGQLAIAEEKDYNRQDEIARILIVDAYAEALRWRENPARQELLAQVKELLLNGDIFNKDVTPRLRQSAYVDRLELFRIVAEQDLSYAATVRESVRPSQYRQYMDEILENLNAKKT